MSHIWIPDCFDNWILEVLRGHYSMELQVTNTQLMRAEPSFTSWSRNASELPEAKILDYDDCVVEIDAYVERVPDNFGEQTFYAKLYLHATETDGMFDRRADVKVPFDVSELEVTEERVENSRGKMVDTYRLQGVMRAITS